MHLLNLKHCIFVPTSAINAILLEAPGADTDDHDFPIFNIIYVHELDVAFWLVAAQLFKISTSLFICLPLFLLHVSPQVTNFCIYSTSSDKILHTFCLPFPHGFDAKQIIFCRAIQWCVSSRPIQKVLETYRKHHLIQDRQLQEASQPALWLTYPMIIYSSMINPLNYQVIQSKAWHFWKSNFTFSIYHCFLMVLHARLKKIHGPVFRNYEPCSLFQSHSARLIDPAS